MSGPPVLSRRGAAGPSTALLLVPETWLRELLASALQQAGCLPMGATDLEAAQRLVATVVPDVVAFDESLWPGCQAWLQGLRHPPDDRGVPALMLGSADARPASGISVVAKPIEPRQFVLEAMRLLRQGRAQPAATAAPIRLGGLVVAADAPLLRIAGEDGERVLTLPRREHALLRALLDPPAQVHSREQLRDSAWGGEPVALRTVDQYVRRLRASLAPHGLRDLVRTVSTAGYRIDPGPLAAAAPARP